MADFRWRVVDGDFGLASDWSNTTLKIDPARVAPGVLDNVTFSVSGGTISGRGSVAKISFNGGPAGPWVLGGQFTAATTAVAAVATISNTGVLDAGQLTIGNTAAITVMDDGILRSSSLNLGSAAALSANLRGRAVVGSSIGTYGAVTVDAGGTLTSAGGKVTGNLIDNGTVSIDGGLTVTGDVSGSGVMALTAGNTLIGGQLAIDTVAFGAAAAALYVADIRGVVQVTGFKPGDTIDIAVGSGFALANLGNGTSLTAAGTTLNFGQMQAGATLSVAPDASGGIYVSLVPPGGAPGGPPPPISLPSTTIPPGSVAIGPSNLPNNPAASVPVSLLATTSPPAIPGAVSIDAGGSATSTKHGAPLMRYFDERSGGHFFTNDATEEATLATRSDLRLEGIGFLSDDRSETGTSDVFRFFDLRDGGHFFTTSAGERDQLITTRPDMVFEGVAFYEQNGPKSGYAPVYRFFDTHDGGHLFTPSASERDVLLASRPDLRPEGISFYAPST